MPAIYTQRIDVQPDSIDENRHVNNRAYLTWMQDVAVAHSAAVGWPMSRYSAIGATWVVRSHYIEYLRPVFEGDALRVHTWVEDLRARRSTRRYLFRRDGDGATVARAETLWVFVDLETGRPSAIPPELRSAFTLIPGGEPEALERLATG